MINTLKVSHLRNLSAVALSCQRCNIIVGANGSGKTSLLEAIYLLSRGKSFRHHQPKRYIQHHQQAVTVYARLNGMDSMAIRKFADASTQLRLNQNTVNSQSQLTQRLPTLLIEPASMDVLEQGSASRRQLLDWLTFHMKHGFYDQWLAYQRLLKQRNSLLKRNQQLSDVQRLEIQAWDKGLANHAKLLHYYRQQVFVLWRQHFADILAQLLPHHAPFISLHYQAGFDTTVDLDVVLQQRLRQDLQLGYTRIGSHRADIQVLWHDQSQSEAQSEAMPVSDYADSQSVADGGTDMNIASKQDLTRVLPPSTATQSSTQSINPSTDLPIKDQATHVLSRGEKKLLITALRLSQLLVLLSDPNTQTTAAVSSETISIKDNSTPVVLLDDLDAELDEQARQVLLRVVSRLPCQVFVSSLSQQTVQQIQQYWQPEQVAVFHVKQGQVSQVSQTSYANT